MDEIVLTLKHQQSEWDLALPTTVPLQQLAEILIEKLDLTELKSTHESSFTISGRLNGQLIIRPHDTLETVRAADGDFLELFIPRGRTDPQLEPPPQKGAYLRSVDTGEMFAVQGNATLIGRLPHHPISLHALPYSDAASRTHANLLRRADGYWLEDVNSRNGTLVDGFMLQKGERVRLRDGCVIQFGVDGPVLIFHVS